MLGDDRARRRGRRGAAATLVAAALLVVAACAEEPTDPTEARRERVQARLEDTFSRQQATCILEQLDDEQLEAIDAAPPAEGSGAEAPLPDLEDPEVLEAYSNATVACVVGLGS